MIIKNIYIIFLGILLALFIGVGIDTFYEAPASPQYPKTLEKPYDTSSSTQSAQIREISAEYDKKYEAYTKVKQVYDRNVSIASLIGAVILLVVSLTTFNKTFVLADGILLGGVLTLLYSVTRGFESNDHKYRFVLITISVIISLVLGYIKFIKASVGKSQK